MRKISYSNQGQSARMRGFSSRFLDNQLEIDCKTTADPPEPEFGIAHALLLYDVIISPNIAN